METNPATLIDMAIKEAGIPIVGVDGQASGYAIDYAPEATPEQRSQGETIRAQILADVETAAAARSKKEIAASLAAKLNDPDGEIYAMAILALAEQISAALNGLRQTIGVPTIPFAVAKADFLSRVAAKLQQ